MPLISIITPVYKAESYLKRFFESVLNQTFTDFELILIDDASPDKSGQICDSYQLLDTRIKTLHNQINKGVSASRQIGFNHVQGKYMIHLDPDDWIEIDMLEKIYNEASLSNSDLVITDFFIHKEDITIKKQKPSQLDAKHILHDLFYHLHGSLCNKLIKVDICKQLKISFPNQINYGEDLLFLIQLLKKKPDLKISYIPKAFYHYDLRTNNNSLTKNYTLKTLEQRKHFVSILEQILNNEDEKKLINRVKEEIKIEAFQHKLLKKKQFLMLYPEIDKRLFTRENLSTIDKILIKAACSNLYEISSFLYHLKKKIRKH